MSKSLYVGNLSFTATQEEVSELFGQYGTVESVRLIKDKITGKPRGFCFVEMTTGEDKALSELNGALFKGRPLRVSEAASKPNGGNAQA